jgi:cytochrome c oxidase cbb3-type subunit 3
VRVQKIHSWRFVAVATRRGSVLLLCAAALLLGCKREERGFRVQPPSAESANPAVKMSDLQPGTPTPDATVENEYEENAFAISEGQRLFNWYNCVGCHGNGGGGMGPPLMDHKWIYGSEPENVYSTIVQGRPNGMPSFRGRIPDYQVWQLVAYVRSMSGLVPHDAATGRPDDMNAREPDQQTETKQPKGTGIPRSAEMPQ